MIPWKKWDWTIREARNLKNLSTASAAFTVTNSWASDHVLSFLGSYPVMFWTGSVPFGRTGTLHHLQEITADDFNSTMNPNPNSEQQQQQKEGEQQTLWKTQQKFEMFCFCCCWRPDFFRRNHSITPLNLKFCKKNLLEESNTYVLSPSKISVPIIRY